MDARVARLKNSQEARQLAENARLAGRLDLEIQALEHGRVLQAHEEGYSSPAELAIANALYAYEQEQNRIQNRTNYRAKRLRTMLKKHGTLHTAERMALDPKRSTGFNVLEAGGRQDMTFEAIIVRYPSEFSQEALEAAIARLEGKAPPGRRKPMPPMSELSEPSDKEVAPGHLDAEGMVFWLGLKTTKKFILDWLPKYRKVVYDIQQALLAGSPDKLLSIIWKTQDNDIANAGWGLIKLDKISDDELVQVIRDVYLDNSAENYQLIVERFESWKAGGRITAVPRLLIARIFAGIHPDNYHTTVDSDSQDKVIKWFVEHTGFLEPKRENWAVRARALTAHMDGIEEIDKDVFFRNMFPWFVAEQLRVQKFANEFQSGHRSRVPATTSHVPEHQRAIDLRHNRVQDTLYRLLATQYGKEKVGTEQPTGTGGYADAIVKFSESEFYLYEIKIADTATEVLRQAMGQLLEYGFRRGGLNPIKLFAVGEPVLDEISSEFLAQLRNKFDLNISYLRVQLEE